MRWVSSLAIAVPLFSTLSTAPFPGAGFTATPAPGDVVVELKIEPSDVVPRNVSPGYPLPTPTVFPSFNSQQLDRQLQQYTAYLEQVGTPDILIVGSSRALQGVDPIALQQGLAEQGYPGLKIYNFGINGATAQVVDWLLHQLIPPERLPKLIIWADGSRAFNSGRVDHTFDKIVSSRGHQLLMSGVRPIPPAPPGLNVGHICMDLLPLPLLIQPTSHAGISGERVPKVVTKERSPHQACKQPIKLVVRHNQRLTASPQSSAHPAETLGFQIVNTRFSPSLYFQRYPRVAGAFDADYRNFELTGNQATAFEKVLRFVNTRRVPLVFVNLPLTSTYLDFTRTQYEDRFRNQMRRAAQSKRFIFKDLAAQPHLSQNHYFADPSHLNRYGATAVSLQLSKELANSVSTFVPRQALYPSPEVSSFTSERCNTACIYLPRMFSG
ncbi:hypothetical protein OsccyDRAFT_2086 [Leptolyngbyaceae cyanobacterium JSC-12]|nr:hypothetical protein OsccyDRAFT_2086 [Leptolyngbyaceae cyanobacterium JSC-12]